jgi:hypothetical protein
MILWEVFKHGRTGTVSPDIGVYFRVYKVKSVFSLGLLVDFKFFKVIVPEIFQN